jgi:hypothetical protein
VLAGGCDHLETGEMVGSLCDPGAEVFCRCANGQPGTRTCGDEGGGFDSCTCGEDGTGGSDDPSAGGAGGAPVDPPSGPQQLLAPCSEDAECASGICQLGFCTTSCAAAAECPGASSCVRFGGAMQLCMPTCGASSDCSAFGAASSCGWTSGVDGTQTTVCGDWAEPSLPPIGTSCEDDVECHLGHHGVQRVCGFGQCMEGCVQGSDCPAGSTCASSGAPIGTCD